MRIVELPFYFASDMNLPLAVLIHRTDKQTVGHDIYLGESYTFDGAVEPTSYQLLTSHNRFAQHGYVMSGYPSSTHTIDQGIGLVVRLDGADKTLDAQTAFNALADDFMVFVGDEIMSVIAVHLVEADTYRLHVIRERLGTPCQEHAEGAEVYLVARKDLLPLMHRSFLVENEVSLKVATATGRVVQDLADVDALTHTIAGQLFTQTTPQNLRVNKALRNAVYSGITDVRIDWSLHELRNVVSAQFGVSIRTLVEIISLVDDSVLYSKLVYGEMFKIAVAKMTTILGGETSFTVRLSSYVLGSNLQLQSDTIQLTVLPS